MQDSMAHRDCSARRRPSGRARDSRRRMRQRGRSLGDARRHGFLGTEDLLVYLPVATPQPVRSCVKLRRNAGGPHR